MPAARVTLPPRLARTGAIGFVALIAVLTLWPVREPRSAPTLSPWCLACGELGGNDVLNNLLLFAPVGLMLVAAGWRLPRAVLAAGLLSLTVETLQFTVIPGRDASLSDLVANTSGAMIGALIYRHRGSWMTPSPRQARAGTFMAGALCAGALAAGAWLMQPAIPREPLVSQWAPRRPHWIVFRGVLHDVKVNGVSLQHSGPPDAASYAASVRHRSLDLESSFTSAATPRRGTIVVTRVVGKDNEYAFLAQSGDAFLFRLRLRASDFLFRSPLLAVAGAFPAGGETVHTVSGLRGPVVYSDVDGPDVHVTGAVPLRAALGWTILVPFTFALAGWASLVSGLWVAGLTTPLGFYAGASGERRSGSLGSWSLAAAALVIGLALVPALVGAYPSAPTDWLGGLVGCVLGAWLARRLARLATSPGG